MPRRRPVFGRSKLATTPPSRRTAASTCSMSRTGRSSFSWLRRAAREDSHDGGKKRSTQSGSPRGARSLKGMMRISQRRHGTTRCSHQVSFGWQMSPRSTVPAIAISRASRARWTVRRVHADGGWTVERLASGFAHEGGGDQGATPTRRPLVRASSETRRTRIARTRPAPRSTATRQRPRAAVTPA